MPVTADHPLMTDYSLMNCQSDRLTPPVRGVAVARSLGRTLRLWRARIRERHAFPVIGDRELSDLRVSRWELEHELSKPFWRD
jgi:uncharacterized protein YjiS (DUF1127 family)